MSRIPRQVCLCVAAIVSAVMLAGCSAATAQDSPAGHIIVVAGEATDAHPDALAKGKTEWGDGGCIVIRGEETYLVIFPHGTTLDDNDTVERRARSGGNCQRSPMRA